MKIFFSSKCLEYLQPWHPESPERVNSSYHYLKEKGFEFLEPTPCEDKDILSVHTSKLLDEVKSGGFFDPDTPALPNIYEYAKLAVGSAINAATLCLTGERTFSLMRPPGHHATRNNLGGFCYFNNIAIASLKIKEQAEATLRGDPPRVGKIAIIDIDCHHGNGTEDILLGKKDFLYLSLHQSPLYPGTGLTSRENCINYPILANTSPEKYIYVLGEGLKHVEQFKPDLLAISAGFDTYKLDPITNLSLEKDTYREIGRMLSKLKKPLFAVLEGGYGRDMPECICQFLIGLEE